MTQETEKEQELDDFGFSMEESISTEDIETSQALFENEIKLRDAKIAKLTKANREMYRKILKLLINLKKNPEKEMIKWPNRVEVIDKFIEELTKLKETDE